MCSIFGAVNVRTTCLFASPPHCYLHLVSNARFHLITFAKLAVIELTVTRALTIAQGVPHMPSPAPPTNPPSSRTRPSIPSNTAQHEQLNHLVAAQRPTETSATRPLHAGSSGTLSDVAPLCTPSHNLPSSPPTHTPNATKTPGLRVSNPRLFATAAVSICRYPSSLRRGRPHRRVSCRVKSCVWV